MLRYNVRVCVVCVSESTGEKWGKRKEKSENKRKSLYFSNEKLKEKKQKVK